MTLFTRVKRSLFLEIYFCVYVERKKYREKTYRNLNLLEIEMLRKILEKDIKILSKYISLSL